MTTQMQLNRLLNGLTVVISTAKSYECHLLSDKIIGSKVVVVAVSVVVAVDSIEVVVAIEEVVDALMVVVEVMQI